KKQAGKKDDDKPEAKDDGLKTSAPAQAGIPTELTADQMKATFLSQKAGYIACIKEEAGRNPEMPGTVTVEFVIRNDGSTGDFKVQEREVRSGPLATCLGAKVGALRFQRFSGERKTFIFPFTIKRK
ncbi:MAG: AgmX/PglI C-terminal domain-containing protein, partial [Myxococcota bacterium]